MLAAQPALAPETKPTRLAARFSISLVSRIIGSSVVYALLLSGLFRLSAFIRETYTAARFGLSSGTDAYFGLQQLPLSVSTFMFGAFALAFAPAYGQARRRGGPEWLPGLLLHATLAGLALMAATLGLNSVLLTKYVGHADPLSLATLGTLSTCYLPIIYLGIWASMLNATGHPLRSMTIAALPYLIMTASLIVICEAAGASLLSLPVSMSIGFWTMGVIAARRIYRPLRLGDLRGVLWPVRFAEFRAFGKQMLASAAENIGFAANQLLMIYFFGLMGAGQVTANNYAMRVGLLANSLITQPVAQLAQSRFCTVSRGELRRSLSAYLRWIVGAAALAGGAIYVLRHLIVTVLYQHGKFTTADAALVTSLIPAWLVYLLILSVNSVASRYLFVIGKGKRYAGLMLCGYLFCNVMRAVCCANWTYAPAVVWCAVAGEGVAMLFGLRACYREAPTGDVVTIRVAP
jgi:putative peptidoglycan lipid II flippase